MHRKIKYKKSDFHLKYLGVDAYYVDSAKGLRGCFGEYMKNEFLIGSLPYKMDILDFIKGDDSSYELFVQLPKSYFDKWINYPFLPAPYRSLDHPEVGYFKLSYFDVLGKESNLLHPYDTNLRDSFVNRYRIEARSDLGFFCHDNGRKYRPYEFYLSYWRGYVFLELSCECKFIEKYLDKDTGSKQVKIKYSEINDRWVESYSSAFNKIASYRTAMSNFINYNNEINHDNAINCSMRKIAQSLIDTLSSSKEELLEDMEALLGLDENWRRKLESTGIVSYEVGLENLKKDIYNLFEWICYLGVSEDVLFSKFDDFKRQPQGFTPLRSVLNFERFVIEKCFKSVALTYSDLIIGKLSVNLDELCSYCNHLEGFDSWIRSFYDLHQSINNDKDISFLQPRLINELLVITIRTEIIVKGILKFEYSIEEEDLKNVFNKIYMNLGDGDFKKILCEVFQRYKLAGLRDALQDDDLFKGLDVFSFSRKRPEVHRVCGESIMKFIVSRNYFAHHSYKDNEIDVQGGQLPRDILISCINTILYVYSATR